MDHSNLYEVEEGQDDYDKLEAKFGARHLLEAARNAPGSEDGSDEDVNVGGGGNFGEASLVADAESNKAGSSPGDMYRRRRPGW